MALENKTDIRDMLLQIDRKIYNRLNIKHKHFFGIASRLRDSEGKLRNFSDLDKAINDGEISLYDDRYNVTWFHRIDTVSFRGVGNSYGRSAVKRTGLANGVTVFWAKRESMNLQGDRFDLYQTDLFNLLTASIYDIEEYSVQRVDFDIQSIENQEFNTKTLHKESILLKFDFELLFNPDICNDGCQEWDCCPI